MTETVKRETVLWLLRHTEPDVRTRGRCYGSLDVALSSEGLWHARSIAEAIEGEMFAAIYTSPRQRCRDLARMIGAGRSSKVDTLDALREMDFGELEGRTWDEIAAQYPEVYRQWMEHPTETQFPGGESFQAMRDRVLASVGELRARHVGGSIVMVTHGGVIRIVLADALGMEAGNLFRIGQSYGAVNRIRYFGATPVVELMNGGGADPVAGLPGNCP
jgi:alpha-ribazole phosphatase